jgi:hypothetical protein
MSRPPMQESAPQPLRIAPQGGAAPSESAKEDVPWDPSRVRVGATPLDPERDEEIGLPEEDEDSRSSFP